MHSSDIYQVGATPGIRSFRCDQGAPNRPKSVLLYKEQGKCQVIPIHCSSSTPANYSCNVGTNTRLAGSGIARCEVGLQHHTDPFWDRAKPSQNHRITESQNSRGWKGPLWVI